MTAFRKSQHSAAQQERMVQKQVSPDFLDPVHEWRRLFAETWGTFLLVLVATGVGWLPSGAAALSRYGATSRGTS